MAPSLGRVARFYAISRSLEKARKNADRAKSELDEVRKRKYEGKASPAEVAIAAALLREAKDALDKIEKTVQASQRIPKLQQQIDKAERGLKRLRGELKVGKIDQKVVNLVEQHLEALRQEYKQASEKLKSLERAAAEGAMSAGRRRAIKGRPAGPMGGAAPRKTTRSR